MIKLLAYLICALVAISFILVICSVVISVDVSLPDKLLRVAWVCVLYAILTATAISFAKGVEE